MSQVWRIIPIGSVLVLFGCSTLPGTLTVEDYLNREITGDTFPACTARAYQAVARRKAWRESNYGDAVLLADKAKAAQAGQAPQLFPIGVRAQEGYRVAALSAVRPQANDALRRAAAKDDCACGPVAAAFDDLALSALAGDWDGARSRYMAVISVCAPD